MELLTYAIAREYWNKANNLSIMQDIGERRALRIELQERCRVTELEAVNILNGFHIDDYCVKYRIKAQEKETEPTKKKRRKQNNRREIY